MPASLPSRSPAKAYPEHSPCSWEQSVLTVLPNTRGAPEAGLLPGLIGCVEWVIPMGNQPSVGLQGNWLPHSSSLPHTRLFCSAHKAYLCSSVPALLFWLTFHFPTQSFTNLWQGAVRYLLLLLQASASYREREVPPFGVFFFLFLKINLRLKFNI